VTVTKRLAASIGYKHVKGHIRRTWTMNFSQLAAVSSPSADMPSSRHRICITSLLHLRTLSSGFLCADLRRATQAIDALALHCHVDRAMRTLLSSTRVAQSATLAAHALVCAITRLCT
jgi:hypothetical protein